MPHRLPTSSYGSKRDRLIGFALFVVLYATSLSFNETTIQEVLGQNNTTDIYVENGTNRIIKNDLNLTESSIKPNIGNPCLDDPTALCPGPQELEP